MNRVTQRVSGRRADTMTHGLVALVAPAWRGVAGVRIVEKKEKGAIAAYGSMRPDHGETPGRRRGRT